MSRVKDLYHDEICMRREDPGDPGNGPFDDDGYDDWIANRESDRHELLEEIAKETADPEQGIPSATIENWDKRAKALGIDDWRVEISNYVAAKAEQKRIAELSDDDLPF